MAAAYGFVIAMRENSSDIGIANAYNTCFVTARPTAVNLAWACGLVAANLKKRSQEERVSAANNLANEMADEDVATNSRIGKFGVDIIRKIADQKKMIAQSESLLTATQVGLRM